MKGFIIALHRSMFCTHSILKVVPMTVNETIYGFITYIERLVLYLLFECMFKDFVFCSFYLFRFLWYVLPPIHVVCSEINYFHAFLALQQVELLPPQLHKTRSYQTQCMMNYCVLFGYRVHPVVLECCLHIAFDNTIISLSLCNLPNCKDFFYC